MDSNTLQAGFLLNGNSYIYKIKRVLGQGSFGITYLASVKMAGSLGTIDANINVAIKEFFMRDINGRSDAAVTSGSKGGIYDEYKRKFTREALNLSKLQHPNIIKVIESFEANNTVYYVMEYIGGGSLDDYIAKNNGLKEDEAVRIIKQIGTALSFMHDNNMLHLDLKPSNIMLKERGDVVLIDFGLSKQYDEKGEPESSTKVGAGTPGYAPIEQANYREGRGFPVTMDVYALGGTMFKMLTGIRPPEASDILNDGFPLYELQEHHVSERISASIAKAMAPTKKDRYSSVENFINSFEEEGTVIDVEVATEKVSHKEYPIEKVFKVRLNTSKVTFEYYPRTPIFQGSYFCSVNKETGVDTNITQESTHIGRNLNKREYTKFLNDLQSLNLKIRDKEIPPYKPSEYSENPAKLSITLYDENFEVYNKLWISGWNNELGNIDGDLYAIEEKVRQIVPMLQEYIDGPYYELPNKYSPMYQKKGTLNDEKSKIKKTNSGNLNFKKWGIAALVLFVIFIGTMIALKKLDYYQNNKGKAIESQSISYSKTYPIDILAAYADEQNIKCPYRWVGQYDDSGYPLTVTSIEYNGKTLRFFMEVNETEWNRQRISSIEDMRDCTLQIGNNHNPLKSYLGSEIIKEIIKRNHGIYFVFRYKKMSYTFKMTTKELKKYE